MYGAVENSSSTDASLYAISADVGSAAFITVKTALRANCLYCHSEWNSYLEADFVNAGLVVSNNPAASKIYYRNANATSGPGPHNMPNGGYPALTNADLANIITWIGTIP